jgi:hypothetical protein
VQVAAGTRACLLACCRPCGSGALLVGLLDCCLELPVTSKRVPLVVQQEASAGAPHDMTCILGDDSFWLLLVDVATQEPGIMLNIIQCLQSYGHYPHLRNVNRAARKLVNRCVRTVRVGPSTFSPTADLATTFPYADGLNVFYSGSTQAKIMASEQLVAACPIFLDKLRTLHIRSDSILGLICQATISASELLLLRYTCPSVQHQLAQPHCSTRVYSSHLSAMTVQLPLCGQLAVSFCCFRSGRTPLACALA